LGPKHFAGKDDETKKDGDFVLWKPDRKGNVVNLTVYNKARGDYQLLTLQIDAETGCIYNDYVHPGTKALRGGDDGKWPAGYAGEKLSVALVPDEATGLLTNITLYPKPDLFHPKGSKGSRPVRLHRQLKVSSEDMYRISTEVYTNKYFYIGQWHFNIFSPFPPFHFSVALPT
jgi:hypothetical protein